MDLGIKGKVAVILAASAGLGRGVAEVLTQEGCEVAICSRSSNKLSKAAEHIKDMTGKNVFHQVADVANAQSLISFLEGVMEKYGKIDILVTNAGGPPPGSSEDLNDEQYFSAYELTLMSVVRSCRFVIPAMRKEGWGRIIILSSTSIKCAIDNLLLSNIFRNAVAGFSKSIAMETARQGIRVHCIMSGPFVTDRMIELGTANANKAQITYEEWKKAAEDNTMMGRFGIPKEMGDLVAFLASDCSDYMTGTCIAIDGGALKTIS
ncbi:SDR family oxidoreductase [Patescibacteria group bacterium]|nr:SDR family oxidoreductase [Patescibacteria group bacterium]